MKKILFSLLLTMSAPTASDAEIVFANPFGTYTNGFVCGSGGPCSPAEAKAIQILAPYIRAGYICVGDWVRDSWLAGLGYCERDSRIVGLAVTHTGDGFSFKGMSLDVVQKWATSRSKGAFFNQNVKGKY